MHEFIRMGIETPLSQQQSELTEIAEANGVAVVVLKDDGGVVTVNNNSVCAQLYTSDEFAAACAQFCGNVAARLADSGETAEYVCHAGLECRAMRLGSAKQFVTIVGRTFPTAKNYKLAADRAATGDWSQFEPDELFDNVLFSGTATQLDKTIKRIAALSDEVLGARLSATEADHGRKSESSSAGASIDDELARRIEEFNRSSTISTNEVAAETVASETNSTEAEDAAAWRSLFGSMYALSYADACQSVIDFVMQRYGITSLAWLERKENRFESMLAEGNLHQREFRISIPADDKLLFEALENELSLDLRERAAADQSSETVALFPVSVGGEIHSALVIGDAIATEVQKRSIAKLCKTVAPELEIIRLREEMKRRNLLSEAVERFNESLKNLDAEDFWLNLTQITAELLQAERGSLLVLDEKNDKLVVKAAVGLTADRIRQYEEQIGERVARLVLQSGEPVVVEDVTRIGLPAAPAEFGYKTNSFVSYPFMLGSRRVGILNITDKADGTTYSVDDLTLLDAIAPQVAVLIDRATLKSQAGEFEQLSVTDMLTGLLNRRYLEERLAEEIKRSNRYGYPMSFMMIDVDHFKSYNDTFGHAEGDRALAIVAKCLRETLRGADIAARYGGEEFSILLPQTTLAEAAMIAGRLRETVATTEFPNRPITISIGIASCRPDLNSPRDLIVAADRALYDAKHRGRNQVRVYDDVSTGVSG